MTQHQKGQGMPRKRSAGLPVSVTSKQPMSISGTPTQRRSCVLKPPAPYTIALGGVLIVNGIPYEAAIAMITAVEGDGSIASPSGIKIAAVAVLLISAESDALK